MYKNRRRVEGGRETYQLQLLNQSEGKKGDRILYAGFITLSIGFFTSIGFIYIPENPNLSGALISALLSGGVYHIRLH